MVEEQRNQAIHEAEIVEIPDIDLKYSTVRLSEIQERQSRIEASVFDIESKNAREVLKNCKWEVINLSTLIENSFYPGRFKRVYVKKEKGIGFLGSAEMLQINPKPVKFLSKELNKINELIPEKGTILLSRSGTIGNLTIVNNTLQKYSISEHSIRIICKDFEGYLYAFLKSKTGQALIKTNIYGAVVDQIEPEHLNAIPIPNPSPILKQEIHNLIQESFDLRDQSNELIDKAESILIKELKLPPIEELEDNRELSFYTTQLSQMDNRVDGSYHIPEINNILKNLNNVELKLLGDIDLSKEIILPGRFKRSYVSEGQGVSFFGGKQIFELNPLTDKFLSTNQHSERMEKELKLHQNMILITRSGTIGKINIVPKHLESWIANEHIIRVTPKDESIAGYLYCWLASDYGHYLITRFTYGSVVDEIDDNHVSKIHIPILKNKSKQQEINHMVLEANEKRYQAYLLEQKAIKMVNDKVIYAK